MTFPEIKFVDAPTAAATVLFDFNNIDLVCKREVEDGEGDPIDFGSPDIQGDPEAVSPMYGPRTVQFKCRLTGKKADVAAAISAMSRALLLNLGPVWLSVKLTENSPLYFFKPYRPDVGSLSFENVFSTSETRVERWPVDVSLPCEPFALGVRESNVAQQQTNDPTTGGATSMRIVLPTVKGDAPAPLTIQFDSSPNADGNEINALAIMHAGSADATTYNIGVGTGDGLTAGTDTAAGASDSPAIGGSSRTCSLASPALATRLSGTTPSMIPAKYRALVHVSALSPTARFVFRLSVDGYGGSTVSYSPTAETTGYTWVDLGEFNFPGDRVALKTIAASNATSTFSLDVGRLGGTTEGVKIDHIYLIPVDAPYTLAPTRSLSGLRQSGGFLVYNADEEIAYTSTVGRARVIATPVGVTPQVVPGAKHTLFMVQRVNATVGSDPLSKTLVVLTTYYPRFLHIGTP